VKCTHTHYPHLLHTNTHPHITHTDKYSHTRTHTTHAYTHTYMSPCRHYTEHNTQHLCCFIVGTSPVLPTALTGIQFPWCGCYATFSILGCTAEAADVNNDAQTRLLMKLMFNSVNCNGFSLWFCTSMLPKDSHALFLFVFVHFFATDDHGCLSM